MDTNIIIYILKGHEIVRKNLLKHLHDPIGISVVTLMDLYYGAYKSQKLESNLAKVRALENLIEIVSLGKESVEIFGIQKARLEKSGTPLDDFDLIQAACAMTHNLILVTNNTKHFERIEGLKLANWAND
ncbi:MAG: type II toxin-antitoxin system VapC family toxin [bacterium]